MLLRHLYALKLEDFRSSQTFPSIDPLRVRRPVLSDRDALISLISAAYAGTIDEEKGLMEESDVEIENYLKGEYGEPLLDHSRVALNSSEEIVSAVLTTRWGRAGIPLVAFVMTAPEMKAQGIARYLLAESLQGMKEGNEREVRAVVTDGNLASEQLFSNLGFLVIETLTD